MRYVMRIAEFSESSNLWTQIALLGSPRSTPLSVSVQSPLSSVLKFIFKSVLAGKWVSVFSKTVAWNIWSESLNHKTLIRFYISSFFVFEQITIVLIFKNGFWCRVTWIMNKRSQILFFSLFTFVLTIENQTSLVIRVNVVNRILVF